MTSEWSFTLAACCQKTHKDQSACLCQRRHIKAPSRPLWWGVRFVRPNCLCPLNRRESTGAETPPTLKTLNDDTKTLFIYLELSRDKISTHSLSNELKDLTKTILGGDLGGSSRRLAFLVAPLSGAAACGLSTASRYVAGRKWLFNGCAVAPARSDRCWYGNCIKTTLHFWMTCCGSQQTCFSAAQEAVTEKSLLVNLYETE